MLIKEYCKNTARTRSKLASKELDNIHMVFGLATEVGEFADLFKGNLAYGKKIDWVNASEEIGDIMWYISEFCNINGFDLEKILENNIKKLQARYPEKFTSENALNRDLEKEREILEKSETTFIE